MGRPKSNKVKAGANLKGLRLKYYEDMPSSKGLVVSGYADQYGRMFKNIINSKNENDLVPTGDSICARH